MGKLKPCPFCGSTHISMQRGWFAVCGKCYATGSAAPTKAEAIKLWNRREAGNNAAD